jgi:hypothetical protein
VLLVKNLSRHKKLKIAASLWMPWREGMWWVPFCDGHAMHVIANAKTLLEKWSIVFRRRREKKKKQTSTHQHKTLNDGNPKNWRENLLPSNFFPGTKIYSPAIFFPQIPNHLGFAVFALRKNS